MLKHSFSQTIGQIGLKFHVKTPYAKYKIQKYKIVWSHDHITRRLVTLVFGIRDVGPTKFVQMMILS